MAEALNVTPPAKDANPRPDICRLVGMCASFLKAKIPDNNIILEGEFSKYIPLFNAESVKDMKQGEVSGLYLEYKGRFSLQHPIKIISAEIVPDATENAIYFPEDRKFHPVVMTLPPMYKPIKTLNEAGRQFPQLINAFANTAASDNPLDHRNQEYAHAIGTVLQSVNTPEASKQYDEEAKKIADDFIAVRDGSAGEEKPVEPSKETQEPSTSIPSTIQIEW